MSTRADNRAAVVYTTMTLSPDRLDELYAVLSDSIRRQILRRLVDHEGGYAFGALVSALSDWLDESSKDIRTLDSLRRRLHHVHLPKLADAGLVVWNRSVGRIERGADWDDGVSLLYSPPEMVT